MIPGNRTASAAFVRELHRALTRLYNPTELARAPLIEFLDLGRNPDPAASLQRILLQAIEAIKPSSHVPSQANAWRIYHILNQRYAGQFPSEEVATNLAISGRQLRRLQALALQALGDRLWAHYCLEKKLPMPGAALASSAEVGTLPETGLPTREQELEQLRSFTADESVSVAEVVHSALSVAGPLIETTRVRIKLQLADDLPGVAVRSITVRHALLSVFTAAIHTAAGGIIEIKVRAVADQIWIEVHPLIRSQSDSSRLAGPQFENLEMARQLAELCGGSIELMPSMGGEKLLTGRLVLPAAEQMAVLVIDDNADTLRLFERYLAGSRYRFTGVADPLQSLAVAEAVRPHLIVLDLMLPGIDGWEILGRLREHPRIHGTPILVCTILPHEDLALALGAAALIRKPVSQEAFRMALDRQLGQRAQGSR